MHSCYTLWEHLVFNTQEVKVGGTLKETVLSIEGEQHNLSENIICVSLY